MAEATTAPVAPTTTTAAPEKAQAKAKPASGAPRSIRITDEIWDPAVERAEAEGHSMISVITELVEGYGRGKISLPQIVKVYPGESVEDALQA